MWDGVVLLEADLGGVICGGGLNQFHGVCGGCWFEWEGACYEQAM